MQKTFLLPVLLFGTMILQAQSTDEARQALYYERFQTAESICHQVLKTNPDNVIGWYSLTKAYLLQNELDKAEDSIRFAPESVSQNPYYDVAVGYILLRRGKTDDAAFHFNRALKATREKDAGVLSAVADAHIHAEAGNGDYALSLLHKAIKRNKHNADLYTQLGDAFRKLNNGTEAYKAYHEAISEDNKHARAYHQVGEIFLSQKNTDLYLEYFQNAVAADPNYAPSYYKLYLYEFYHDVAKALNYYKLYLANTDQTIQNEYDMADLLYLDKQYDKAIARARQIIVSEDTNTKPRLFKLLGYSLAESGDTTAAISNMRRYFAVEADSNFISKDFETMAALYAGEDSKTDLAIVYYKKAVELQDDSTLLYAYYKRIADLAKESNDHTMEAEWRGKYFNGNDKATNVDLFNWGIAGYRAGDYTMADSVFTLYSEKYPEQGFGYYWQARARSLLDKEMEQGLAVPAYQKLVEVLEKDTANVNYKKWMIEAYGYLAAYETNKEKDYEQAIDYFEEILELDPDNENVKKYIAMLEKDISSADKK